MKLDNLQSFHKVQDAVSVAKERAAAQADRLFKSEHNEKARTEAVYNVIVADLKLGLIDSGLTATEAKKVSVEDIAVAALHRRGYNIG